MRLLSSTGATAWASILAGAVPLAMGSPAAAVAAATTAAGSRTPVVLQEVIVTARHREENIQNVPISITAISGSTLKDQQVTSAQDLTKVVPNLQFSQDAPSSGNSTTAVIFIRGIGQTDFLASEDPGVGFYVDGVYFANTAGTAAALLDLKDVQVLRGPQGTLFGRNTIGGAVVLQTNPPDLKRAYGSASIAFGRFQRRDYTLIGNLPLSSTLGIRVAATRQVDNGYVDAILTGRELGDKNTDAARIEALWQPNDQFNLLWEADDFADHSNGPPTVFGGINTGAPFPEYASYAAGCPGATPVTPVPETSTIDPRCANNAYLSLGPYSTDQNGPERSDTHVWGTHLTATWQVNPSFTVKSITAYRETKPDSIRDADNTPLIILETINQDDMKQYTEELRLQGTALGDRLNWQTGAFYFRETDPQYYPAYLPLPAPDIVNSINIAASIKNISYAFYTQESYRLTRKVQLTGGVRYTADVKDATPYFTAQPPLAYSGTGGPFYADQLTGGNPVYLVPYPGVNPYDPAVVQGYEANYPASDFACLGGPVAVAVAQGIGGTCVGSTQYLYDPVLNQLHDHKITPMASLQYAWTPRLMTYLSYSIGYKSGGFNTRIIQPVFSANNPTGRNLLPSYGPETVYSYEAGAKLSTPRLRLDGDVFFENYQDVQLEVREGAAPVLENAGGAHIKGVELSGTILPLRGLSVDFGLGYLDFHYTSLSAGLLNNSAGEIPFDAQQAYTPRWSGNLGLSYHIATPIGSFVPRIGGSFHSLTYYNAINELRQPAYQVYDGSVKFIDATMPFSITGGVTNLSNKVYIESAESGYDSPIGYREYTYAPPRAWFLEGTVNF